MSAQLTLRYHRRPVHQKLRPGDDDLISRLEAGLHFIVVANRLPDRQGFLPCDERSAILRLCDECEILSGQPRHRQNRNFRILMGSPYHPRADELRLPERVVTVRDSCFHQHGLRGVVDLR